MGKRKHYHNFGFCSDTIDEFLLLFPFIVRKEMSIPPITTSFEWVPELSHTISPMVVIMPDVSPKLGQVFSECLIKLKLESA